MSRDPNDPPPEDPTDQFKQGLGLLWKAARTMATGAKKELDRTDFGKAIDDAGRELVRATSTVMDRIATEVSGKPPKRDEKPDMTTPKEPDEDDEFDGVTAPKKKPTGPTPEDPGFRIMVDDDDKKPK